MLRQKFKKIINGVLAAVMFAGTFTAVSYVQPVSVSAANGDTAWYNPALRWKNTDDNRENVLMANSVVGQDTGHCSNAECPSNSSDGYKVYIGGETFYQQAAYLVEYYDDTDGDGEDELVSYWADITSAHNALDENGLWTEYGVVWYWAKSDKTQAYTSDNSLVTPSMVDEDGKVVNGGDNTGTSLSQTLFTTFRVPEYTADGKSYADTKSALRYGPSFPHTDKDKAIAQAKNIYGCTDDEALTHIVYAGAVPTEVDENKNPIAWGEGWAVVGYMDSEGILIAGAKITAPQDGGKYTQHHFSANYCQSCGVWGTMDNDIANREINNGVFAINSCALDGTSLHDQAGVEATVERTYAFHDYDKDTKYHKVMDDTLPVCLYCFGTDATTTDTQYHYHKHDEKITNVSVVSPNAMAVTRVCLDDTGTGTEGNFNTDASFCASYTYGLTTGTGGPVGISGCGYEETDYYTGLKTVQDYVGVVDGETHYVSFDGVEVKESGDGDFVGDEDNNELEATLTWYTDSSRTREGDPPHKLVAGTSTGYYTITYKLPESLRESVEDETSDANKEIVYNGVATVTLIPQNYNTVDSVLNPNYTSSGTTASTTLLNNLVSTSGTSTTSYDFGSYDAYEVIWDEDLGEWVIVMGNCNESGSYHKYTKMGTETEDGVVYDIWQCVYCNDELFIVIGTAGVTHVHHYYKYDEIPATCTSTGMIFRRCYCGAIETETTAIDPSNHVGTAHYTDPAPTCEDAGYEYDQCVGCGTILNGKLVEKLGHQWSVTSITNNTGHVPNYVIQTCERCNKQQVISSSAAGVSGATCTAAVTMSDSSTAHDYEYMYDIVEDDNTYQVWQCSICGAVEKRLVEATGHTYAYRYTERDCTTGEFEIWQCTGCGEIEKRMTASATGHLWIEQSGGRASTCTVNGYKSYICSKCALTKVEMLDLDKDNHVWTYTDYSVEEADIRSMSVPYAEISIHRMLRCM